MACFGPYGVLIAPLLVFLTHLKASGPGYIESQSGHAGPSVHSIQTIEHCAGTFLVVS